MKTPANFYKPLAIGAPDPVRELPVTLERTIHFLPPHIEKMRAKAGAIAKTVDVLLGNLEDAIPIEAKVAARKGFVELAQANDFGQTGLWTRVNCLNSPWFLDDMTEVVAGVGNKLDVVMIPKVEGPWDIHFVDQLLSLLEADGAGGEERRRDRRGQPAYARLQPGPGRPGRLPRHEDYPRRRRSPLLRRAR